MYFDEEFKEIHANTDPKDMSVSKQEVSASPPKFKPMLDTNQLELLLVMPPRPPPGISSIRNRKMRSSSSSMRTKISLHGNLLT
jgi:hypothetical protein